jgi:prolyl-tRNA synthetase
VPLASIKDEVLSRFEIIQVALLEKATAELNERIFDCSTVDDVKERVQDGIALVPWCGEEKCGLDLDEQAGAGILGIPTDMDEDGTYKCPICSKETRTRVYVARTY